MQSIFGHFDISFHYELSKVQWKIHFYLISVHLGVTWGSLGGHLGLLGSHFGVTWGISGVTLVSTVLLGSHSEVTLGPFEHLRLTLGHFGAVWNHLWVTLGSLLNM